MNMNTGNRTEQIPDYVQSKLKVQEQSEKPKLQKLQSVASRAGVLSARPGTEWPW
jgi:hypothetical protein